MQRLQRETTSRQVAKWKWFIEWELEQPRREDFYLAQIAQVVRQGQVRSPRLVQLKHFLLKLSMRKQKPKGLFTETEKRAKLANSKAYWGAVAGLKTELPEKVRLATEQKRQREPGG